MEIYQIIMIVVALIVILGVALWQIFGPSPIPPIPGPPTPPGPPGPPPKSNNWPRVKEVFFVAITSTLDMVDTGNVASYNDNKSEYLSPELKPALYKRHFFYDIASLAQISTACSQGFNPPGPGTPPKLSSNTFDPNNILLMGVHPFTVGTSKSFESYNGINVETCYIGNQIGNCKQVEGFGTSLRNNLQIVPLQQGSYNIKPTTSTVVTTNCLNTGPQLTSVILNTSSFPKSITYPVYGYKPAPQFNNSTCDHVFQSTFISSSYTSNLSCEIVPYSPDSWYYNPVSNGSNYTNGYELLVFKIDISKVPVDPSLPGWIQPFSKSYQTATLDDLEYSFSKGYNRSEYINIRETTQYIFANVVMTPGANFGINLYQFANNTPTEGTEPMSAGQYSGTVLVPTRDDFASSDPQNVITWPSCKNPQPTQPQYDYITFWGIKPSSTTWIQELLTPKAQPFAPASITLLPFTDGSVGGNFFSNIFGGAADKWSMYS